MTIADRFLTWQALVSVIVLYCVVPYTVLWVAVRCWPKDHDRRNEYLAEYDAVPMWRRPFWVADAAIRSLLDGPTARWAQRDKQGAEVALGQAIAGRTIAVIVAGFVVLSLVMVLSSTSASPVGGVESSAIFNRQLMWAGLSLIALLVVLQIPYQRWRTLVAPGLLAAAGAMMLPFAPGVGVTISGASSWVRLGSFGFQPSEFLKLAVIAFLADYFARREAGVHVPRNGIWPVAAAVVGCTGICLLQGEPGVAIVLGTVILAVGLIAGMPLSHLGTISVVGVGVAAVVIGSRPPHVGRVPAFGGIEGDQHPRSHSDFIFAVVADDLGFIGSVAVIGGFALLVWFGIQVALGAPDRFGLILAGGITTWFGLQTIVNLGAIVGLLPAMGLTLPFVSAGGTSLYVSMIAVGLLLNVARQVRDRPGRATPTPAGRPINRRKPRDWPELSNGTSADSPLRNLELKSAACRFVPS